jgi:hypothetical protein
LVVYRVGRRATWSTASSGVFKAIARWRADEKAGGVVETAVGSSVDHQYCWSI